jgi:hypothetical protein
MNNADPESKHTDLFAYLAQKHRVGVSSVRQLFSALQAGGGDRTQFSIPELGGMGQWSSSGMLMIGDMFNDGLKAKVADLCSELSKIAREHANDKQNSPERQHQGDRHAASNDNWYLQTWACLRPPVHRTPCNMHFSRQRGGSRSMMERKRPSTIPPTARFPVSRNRKVADKTLLSPRNMVRSSFPNCGNLATLILSKVRSCRSTHGSLQMFKVHEVGDEMIDKTAKEGVPQDNRVLIDVRIGGSSARLELKMTPIGLISVGILVSSILLSVPPIIRAATRQR